MYDDDILFDVPPLPEFDEEELELRLAEHHFEDERFPALSLADLEAALAVMAIMGDDSQDEDEDEDRPLFLH